MGEESLGKNEWQGRGEAALLLPLFPLDRSGDDASANKELNSGAQGVLGTGVGAEDRPAASAADLLEVWEFNDDDYAGVVGEFDDDADVEKVGWGVGPGDGDGFNAEAGGAPAVDLAWPRCCE